jgi:hypothetical protein
MPTYLEGRGYAEIGARWRTPYMCDGLEKNVIVIASDNSWSLNLGFCRSSYNQYNIIMKMLNVGNHDISCERPDIHGHRVHRIHHISLPSRVVVSSMRLLKRTPDRQRIAMGSLDPQLRVLLAYTYVPIRTGFSLACGAFLFDLPPLLWGCSGYDAFHWVLAGLGPFDHFHEWRLKIVQHWCQHGLRSVIMLS